MSNICSMNNSRLPQFKNAYPNSDHKPSSSLSGWKEIVNDAYAYHNLRNTPIQIKTNSRIGSREEICIALRNNVIQSPALKLCINFDSEVIVYVAQPDHQCQIDEVKVTFNSNTDDRIWKIHKTLTSYRISGNVIDSFDMNFKESHCGEIAKTLDFGWLQFKTAYYDDKSTASYFIENTSTSTKPKYS